MAWPVVIATNGIGIPVTESDSDFATPVEIADNGMGTPVVLVDSGGAPIKGGGVPSWAVGADYWGNLVNGMGNVVPLLTDIHDDSLLADNSAGSYSAFAANVLVRTDNGAQVVPTRTNSRPRSQAFTDPGNWTKTNVTAADNQITAPDGTLTGGTITENGGSSTHILIGFNVAIAGGQTSANSIFLKRKDFDWVQVQVNDGVTAYWQYINLATGELGTTSGTPVVTVTAAADGWWRVTHVKAVNAAATFVSWRVYLSRLTGNAGVQSPSYQGDSASGVYVWGGQTEINVPFASQYIPTAAAAVAVDGNLQTADLTGFAPDGESGFVTVNPRGTKDGDVLFSRNDGTANEWFGFVRDGANLDFRVIDGGVTQADIELGAMPTTECGLVWSLGENYAEAAIVGEAIPTPDETVTLPTVDTMALMGDGYSATRNAYGNTTQIALQAA
jgi:hypothetical protein